MVTAEAVRRGDVVLVSPDPTQGREIRKTRPCVVVSPDELNAHVRTLIVAPLTTGGHLYPFRVLCRYQERAGSVEIDQIRTIDRERLAGRVGKLSPQTLGHVLSILREMFAR
jgi:mRNA interferase MazF